MQAFVQLRSTFLMVKGVTHLRSLIVIHATLYYSLTVYLLKKNMFELLAQLLHLSNDIFLADVVLLDFLCSIRYKLLSCKNKNKVNSPECLYNLFFGKCHEKCCSIFLP